MSQETPQHMHIAVCSSIGYLRHACAAITSVLTHNSARQLTLHLVSPPLEEEHVRAFDGLREIFGADIRFIEMDMAKVAHLVESKYVERESYFRLFLARLLPEVNKVLCLDADLIVTDSLSSLWNTDITNSPLAAVPTSPGANNERLGLGDDPYINAGVLLLNLAWWREHQYLEEMLDWLENTPPEKIMHMDQDAINVIAKGRKVLLDWRWNFNPALPEKYLHEEAFVTEDHSKAPLGIWHFYGPIKPWHKWFDMDLQALYERHLQQSPWRDAKPDEPENVGQAISVANQFAARGRANEACRYYHWAVNGHAKQSRITSAMEVDLINLANQRYGQQDLHAAIQLFQILSRHWGFPTTWRNQTSAYSVPGAMQVRRISPPLA